MRVKFTFFEIYDERSIKLFNSILSTGRRFQFHIPLLASNEKEIREFRSYVPANANSHCHLGLVEFHLNELSFYKP